MKEFDQLFETNQPEIEKLTRAFDWVLQNYIAHSECEIELIKALGDGERLVKEQIKLGTIKHVRSIYNFCHLKSTGRKAWDEPIN